MQESLVPLKIPPGVFRNGTEYQAAARWYDANGVRFTDGTIRPIGGWRVAQDADGNALAPLSGVPRGSHAWRGDDGVARVAFGTHTHLYVLLNGALYDVTPVGLVAGRPDAGYAAGSGAYGAGPYGAGLFGTGSLASALLDADVWQFDNFGEFLVATFTADGRVFVWDGDITHKAAPAPNSPALTRAVVVTPERFIVALGADGVGRRAKWASQETTDVWAPTETNTAGDFDLAATGRLLAGRRTRRETLLFTDTDVHTMTYIGGLLVYAFAQAGDNCGLRAPNAVAVADTQAYWMGKNNFFVYDGFVQPIACEVRDYVFGDFNEAQAAKVFAHVNGEYGEVWWFYPSAGSTENDRYVVLNYREKHWTIGKLERTAGFGSGATPLPMLCAADGTVYEHEVLDDRAGITPYVESGPLELGGGDRVARVQRVVPDERSLGDCRVLLFGRMLPTLPETAYGPFAPGAPTNVRMTARQVRLRIEEALPTNWRVGIFRLGVKLGGRR